MRHFIFGTEPAMIHFPSKSRLLGASLSLALAVSAASAEVPARFGTGISLSNQAEFLQNAGWTGGARIPVVEVADAGAGVEAEEKLSDIETITEMIRIFGLPQSAVHFNRVAPNIGEPLLGPNEEMLGRSSDDRKHLISVRGTKSDGSLRLLLLAVAPDRRIAFRTDAAGTLMAFKEYAKQPTGLSAAEAAKLCDAELSYWKNWAEAKRKAFLASEFHDLVSYFKGKAPNLSNRLYNLYSNAFGYEASPGNVWGFENPDGSYAVYLRLFADGRSPEIILKSYDDATKIYFVARTTLKGKYGQAVWIDTTNDPSVWTDATAGDRPEYKAAFDKLKAYAHNCVEIGRREEELAKKPKAARVP